jgi:hypothetical protein
MDSKIRPFSTNVGQGFGLGIGQALGYFTVVGAGLLLLGLIVGSTIKETPTARVQEAKQGGDNTCSPRYSA